MSMNKTCAISGAISLLISVDMDGERPRHLYHFALSRFSQAGLGETGASRSDEIAPRNLFTPGLGDF